MTMIDTRFASGLSLFATAELAGASGGALPACFARLPVATGGAVDALQNGRAYADGNGLRRSKCLAIVCAIAMLPERPGTRLR